MSPRIVIGLFLASMPAFCDWNPQLAANYLDGRQKEWFAWPRANTAVAQSEQGGSTSQDQSCERCLIASGEVWVVSSGVIESSRLVGGDLGILLLCSIFLGFSFSLVRLTECELAGRTRNLARLINLINQQFRSSLSLAR
jgi:hypothetical protein